MTQSEFRLLLLRFALLPVICLVALGVLTSLEVHQITRTRAEGSRATSMLLQTSSLLNSLVDEETSIRGFLATGDKSFLEPYHDVTTHLHTDLDNLASAAAADPGLAAQVTGIRADFDRFELIDRQLLDATATPDKTTPLLLSQKQAMDTLRHRLGELIRQLQASRENARQKLAGIFAELPLAATISGLIVAFLIVWDGIRQFRRISRAFGKQITEIEVQRNQLDTTLHSIGDAVVVTDAFGKITLFNPTAEAVSGWTKTAALGTPLSAIFQIVNEHSRQPVESPVEKVLRTGQIVGLANHTLLIRKDKSEVAIDDSGAPIYNDKGQIAGVVLVFRDIQARRQAERELALRKAELESLFANSPAGFATFDRSRHLVRVNSTMAAMSGPAVLEHPNPTLKELLPASAQLFADNLDAIFAGGQPLHREFTGPRPGDPDAEQQWLMWFYPILASDSETDAAQEPELAGVIAIDTTHQFNAQKALVRTEKLAAVGQLAASIAHEMNNPLTAVTNLLYLVGCDDTLNPTTRGYVDRAGIELERVSRMATQTLRFARRSMAPAYVDLDELIQGVLLLYSGRLSHASITVSRRKRAISPFHGYASEVVQVVSNLVSNAIDAIGSPGRLTIALQDATNLHTGQPSVAITVADSGPGIPEPIRKKVWEPFFTTKAETGTGLGLWLIDETIRKNGGSIHLRTATSPKLHGTVFRVLLPRKATTNTAPLA